MWKKILICATLAALMAVPAEARGHRGHRGHRGSNSGSVAALGGFLTGLIVSDVLTRPVYSSPVVISDSWSDVAWRTEGWDYGRPHYGYGRYGSRYSDRYGHRPDYRRGEWVYRDVRVWVPGRWEIVYDRYGLSTRVWRKGFYDVRREKMWVPTYRGY